LAAEVKSAIAKLVIPGLTRDPCRGTRTARWIANQVRNDKNFHASPVARRVVERLK
jgi:hypothetical protein